MKSQAPQDVSAQVGQPALTTLMTARDVRQVLNLDKRSFYRELAAGRIPKPVRLGGRRTRWRVDRLRAWLDSLEQ